MRTHNGADVCMYLSSVVKEQPAQRPIESRAPYSMHGSLSIHMRGGADGDRTHDLGLAKPALSQLSYGPVPCWRDVPSRLMGTALRMVGLERVELSTPRLSSVCSNQLSYRPVPKPAHFVFSKNDRSELSGSGARGSTAYTRPGQQESAQGMIFFARCWGRGRQQAACAWSRGRLNAPRSRTPSLVNDRASPPP